MTIKIRHQCTKLISFDIGGNYIFYLYNYITHYFSIIITKKMNNSNKNIKIKYFDCYFSSTPQKNDINNKYDEINSSKYNTLNIDYASDLNDSIQRISDHVSFIQSNEEIQMEISNLDERETSSNLFEMNITDSISTYEPLYGNKFSIFVIISTFIF